jgi:hypothetical protein
MGTLQAEVCALMIISRSIILRMRNVSDKSCTGNQNALFYVQYFFSESLAVYEIMWKNIVQPDRPLMTIWRTRATNIHLDYVIIIAFPLQQWLQERTSMLRYTYIVVCCKNAPLCYGIRTLPVLFSILKSVFEQILYLCTLYTMHVNSLF